MYELITRRHSIRKYTSQQVSDEDISKIIDAGLAAPSGQNTQPWHFTIIKDKQVQKELVDNCKQTFMASSSDWRKN